MLLEYPRYGWDDIHALPSLVAETLKTCPYCAEEIQDAARKCKHCGEFLDKPEASLSPAEDLMPTADPPAKPAAPSCRMCGGTVQPGAARCPHCGELLRVGARVEATEIRTATEPTQNPQLAQQHGCAGGCGAAFAMVALDFAVGGHGQLAVFGSMVGAAVGFLLGQAGAPKTDLLGPCPYCNGSVRALGHIPGFDCPHCKKRILIRDRQFIQA